MLIFALRHADRIPEPVDALSDTGKVRAELLARMLAKSGIRNAYCSSAKRTQDTIEPLKALLGGALTVHKFKLSSNNHEQEIVTAVRALPADSTAVVIGHSNTIGTIINFLTNKAIDPIEDNEFDKLFVVSIPAGSPSVTLLKYGEPTP